MALDYNYIANQIVLMYNAGRPTTEGIDVREVEALVKEAHAEVGRQEYFENYKAENQSTVNGQWLVNYPLPLIFPNTNPATRDDRVGYVYASLSENYLSLPKNRGVVRVAVGDFDYKGKKQLAYIGLENYENIRGGGTIKFIGDYFYTQVAKMIYILPSCNNPIKFKTIVVTQAVANDATLNESHTMLIIQKVLPMMNLRYARRADMATDANPNSI